MGAPARGGDAASSPCACSPPCLFEAEVLLLIRSGRLPREDSGISLWGLAVLGTLMAALRAGFILFRRRRHVKDAAAARAAGPRHADYDALHAARLKQLCEIHRARVAVRRVVEHPDGTRCGEFLVRAGHGGEHPVLRRHGPAGAGADEPSAAPTAAGLPGDLQCADRRPRLRRGGALMTTAPGAGARRPAAARRPGRRLLPSAASGRRPYDLSDQEFLPGRGPRATRRPGLVAGADHRGRVGGAGGGPRLSRGEPAEQSARPSTRKSLPLTNGGST